MLRALTATLFCLALLGCRIGYDPLTSNNALDDADLQDADLQDAGDDSGDASGLSFFSGIGVGMQHACAIVGVNRELVCWGDNEGGQLGHGDLAPIGDDESPAAAAPVDLGGTAVTVDGGWIHTCASLDNGAVRCWGNSWTGQLGYGNTDIIGDDESPASAGDVDVGGSVQQIALGDQFSCALLTSGSVRCWGRSNYGQLGHGSIETIGDDESPASAGDISLGGLAVQISAGLQHACALLDSGEVRCWGQNSSGQLGLGHVLTIGDDELPSTVGPIDLGPGRVVEIKSGWYHNCARFEDGAIRCWGSNDFGQLGYGSTIAFGDDETPAAAGDVPVGGPVQSLALGAYHSCVVLDSGAVRCWGQNNLGQLGYGHVNTIGDDEEPASAGDVVVGGQVRALDSGFQHNCAVLENSAVRCWGYGIQGWLGYGNRNTIGDDEDPASAGDVLLR